MGKTALFTPVGRREIGVEIAGVLLLAFVAFSFLGVYGEHMNALAGDGSSSGGVVGRFIGSVLISNLGILAAYYFLFAAAASGSCVLFRLSIPHPRTKLIALFGVLLPATSLLEWSFVREPLLGGAYHQHGGYLGEFLGYLLDSAFDKWGTRIFLLAAFSVGFLLATDLLISPFLRLALARGRKLSAKIVRGVPAAIRFFHFPPKRPRVTAGAARGPAALPASIGATGGGTAVLEPVTKNGDRIEFDDDEPDDEEDEEYEDDDDVDDADEEDEDDEADDDDEQTEEEDSDPAAPLKGALAVDDLEDDLDDEIEVEFEEEMEHRREQRAEAKRLGLPPPVEPEIEPDSESRAPRHIQITHRMESAKAAEHGLAFEEKQLSLDGVYSLPPMSLLDDPPPPAPGAGREELEEVAIKIEQTLASFKIEARVENVLRGPVITQYEVSLAAGIKVHKIVSLSDDLAMALSAQSVRVVAPIPGKSAVGIEVPNRTRESVLPKELLLCPQFMEHKFAIPLLLGKDAAGTPIVEDLARMPHLLIAGSTGSGKSVCINSIISSMLMTKTPDELKLILVDPKMVELSSFEEIPHLLTPVITDMKKAPAALEWLCRKMDDRYRLLNQAEVRNIAGYNELGKDEVFARLSKKISHEEAEQAPAQLPYIVIIIDELADLVMTACKEVEASIIRLSQKSRAVGIHVIVATQRPSVDVLTGLIKANLPCRISFQVAGRVDSRTIIDRNGAEKLLGRGDMLFLAPGSSSVVRAQATYISDKEIKKIVRFLQKEKAPEFNREIATYLEVGTSPAAADGQDGGVDDELFDEAVRVIIENQRGSASLLQRRLGIGYTRASRLMDIMGDQGIVGGFKDSKAREVLMTIEEWEARGQSQ